jgi:hypothetical protein
VINTTAVIRHALHDAEHHLLDIRRGIARQQLRPGSRVSTCKARTTPAEFSSSKQR